LAAKGGAWRIIGVSLRSAAPAEELTPRTCLYTMIERSTEGTSARVIGSIAAALALKFDRQAVLDAPCAPATKIVSLTVTEKGYGIDRATGGGWTQGIGQSRLIWPIRVIPRGSPGCWSGRLAGDARRAFHRSRSYASTTCRRTGRCFGRP
jgi:hypothetical protein